MMVAMGRVVERGPADIWLAIGLVVNFQLTAVVITAVFTLGQSR